MFYAKITGLEKKEKQEIWIFQIIPYLGDILKPAFYMLSLNLTHWHWERPPIGHSILCPFEIEFSNFREMSNATEKKIIAVCKRTK